MNLISVDVLERKGYIVVSMEGKSLLWLKNEYLNLDLLIGNQEGGLYKLPGQVIHSLARDAVSPS